LACMIPSPMKTLCELMISEKYCIYVALERCVPRNDNKHYDFIRPMDQGFLVTTDTRHKRKRARTFVSSGPEKQNSGPEITTKVCTNSEE
jgi:hypothetical protein